MSASRRVTSTSGRCKASVSRSKEHPAPRGASKVLAERNQAVVAVGAWVEESANMITLKEAETSGFLALCFQNNQ
uniref:Uncharacterized protein n=1 Tax=Cyclopterus lumpus TaxID=8103 RepID=A0A8C2ZR07_CYCLU